MNGGGVQRPLHLCQHRNHFESQIDFASRCIVRFFDTFGKGLFGATGAHCLAQRLGRDFRQEHVGEVDAAGLNRVGPDGSVLAHETEQIRVQANFTLGRLERDAALQLVVGSNVGDRREQRPRKEPLAVLKCLRDDSVCVGNLRGKDVANFRRGEDTTRHDRLLLSVSKTNSTKTSSPKTGGPMTNDPQARRQ